MFYRYPVGTIKDNTKASKLALIHTLAHICDGILVVHLYLITTGHTLTSNLKHVTDGGYLMSKRGIDEKKKQAK